jgi:hypothetical protein
MLFLVHLGRTLGAWLQLNNCPGFLNNARCA